MIVSSGLGAYDVIIGRKKRNFKSVQRAVPDSSIVSETPRQVPMFNISKHIAKPFIYNDEFKPKRDVVPLKSLQEGSHAAGVSLFNAPVFLIPEALKHPVPQSSGRYVDLMEDYYSNSQEIGFETPFDYYSGIRPGVRAIKRHEVIEEPDAPFPVRTGKIGHPLVTMGTYKIGAKDYDILGS